jgi:peptidoglycan hydrolase-like protein with peptidoglycan-binding domain
MLSGARLLRVRIVGLAVAIAAVLAAGTWFALTRASALESTSSSGSRQSAGAQTQTASARPLRVVSVSPALYSTGVNGASPVRIVFSAPLAAGSPLPRLTPRISGSWERGSGDSLLFAPERAFAPETVVKLRIPAGSAGVRAVSGGVLAKPVSARFRTGTFDTLRLDQLLAQLGYLPLNWAPATSSGTATSGTASNGAAMAAAASSGVASSSANAEFSAAYSPPAGTFTWQAGYPRELRTFWRPGGSSLVLTGAVMAFESDHGMTMDGIAGQAVWAALLRAAARGEDNTNGYTYARASEASPETLTIWHNGRKVFHSLANTGIPVAPTTIGTAPVYLRYRFQIMKGTNPDGSQYADPVSFVAYFRAGEAVHYFPRYSYGFQQSLGCVELPYSAAEQAWPYLTYGSLVTVAAP